MRLSLCGLILIGGLSAGVTAGCASSDKAPITTTSDEKTVELLMSGRMKGKQLDAALKEAQKHPLGSDKNPVRADLSIGEHSYLNRLRCKDNTRPSYERPTNPGPGVYGSNVDTYDVICPNSEPHHSIVVMDSFFPGYVEHKAIDGFTIETP
jgi:hypothetical protein